MASKTELAKAYVEIIPSATGIGGKISEALGGEVTAAGATAGQSLGKSLIGAVRRRASARCCRPPLPRATPMRRRLPR